MKSVGRHVLVEYYGCDPEILGDASLLEKAVVKAAKDAGRLFLTRPFTNSLRLAPRASWSFKRVTSLFILA